MKKTITLNKITFMNYSDLFLGSIQYPDQVDDSCLFYLIYFKDEKPFDELLNNEDALYRYNQWLKYGFLEFRGYSSKSTPQNEISNRLIARIRINHSNPKNQLLVKTLKMFDDLQLRAK